MPTPNRQIKVPTGKQSAWRMKQHIYRVATYVTGMIGLKNSIVLFFRFARGMRVLQHRRTAKCVHANPCDEAVGATTSVCVTR
jgi:hypothetical protein